jgi:hypothetical protein
MAGIKVPQYEIFKIGTKKLKYNNWNLTINKDEAFVLGETVSLFEAQEFRLIANILNKPIRKIDFSKYIMSVVIDNPGDFSRATNKKGIVVNGITYKRFVGTTGGLKNNTLLFVNTEVLDELNRRCECKRNKDVKLVPAKLEAYKALTCSASQPIAEPRRILVVRDCITKFIDTVINIDDSNEDIREPVMTILENVELENNVSDGFNLCTIDYMKRVSESLGLDYVTSGVCLRNAWLKGMLYPFPIIEFIEKYNNGEYMIEDVWGNKQDIRECDMIVTESSLKLWVAYDSIDDYMSAYKECGYGFAVTKISSQQLDDTRELNYQYLQSYDFTDEDIKELCAPTIKYLKDSLCGDYESTIAFLGINNQVENNTWQQALYKSKYMLNDPFIIDSVHKAIKKKINNAKIGKLIVNGNYQIASGDPFALMQSICGLEITGLLKADECYSKYWSDKDVNEVVIFRSPMTSHNNIRKCNVVSNDEVHFWYQYMDTIMIINAWDSFCMAANGCDWDGDILFSTNNPVLARNHKRLPAIQCCQRNTEKVLVTEKDILKTNKNGMGNKVGSITNKVTAMVEVLSHFESNTDEYKELEYRIACGQLYQQNELDKIKGIVARPMPSYWYNFRGCKGNEYQQSLCVEKKPYFMTYVYDDYRRDYKNYIDKANTKCMSMFNMSLDEVLNKENKSDTEESFVYWFHKKMQFGMGACAMNRICWYVESEFENYKYQLKHNGQFDYNRLKVKRRCTEEHRQKLLELSKEYIANVAAYKKNKANNTHDKDNDINEDKNIILSHREHMKQHYRETAREICPDDNERLNIILDMCYGYKNNKQFCWDCIGDLILKRLEELESDNN